MKKPLVSIIMSAYNERIDWVRDSIESIIKQTYDNLEIIIILDNPKNSEIDNLIKDYSRNDYRIRYFINEKNLGLTKCLNIGLEKAQGKYIARMDADDVCMENRIEEQVKFLEENDDIDFVSCNYILIDEESNHLYETKNYGENANMTRECLAYRSIFAHPTWTFRKSIMEKLKHYNEVERAEDYDFLCRLISNGYSAMALDKCLLMCRTRSGGGLSSSNLLRQKKIEYIIKSEYKLDLKGKKRYCTNSVNDKIKLLEVSQKEKDNYNISNDYYLSSISSFKKGRYFKFVIKLIKSIYYYPRRCNDIFSVVKMNQIKKFSK